MNTTGEILAELDHLFETGEISRIEPFLKEQIAAAKKRGDQETVVSLCSELGGWYRGRGSLKESLEAFEEALQGVTSMRQQDSSAYGVLLLNTAGTLRLMRRFEEALDRFRQAENVLFPDKEDGHFFQEEVPRDAETVFQRASFLNNRSLLFQDMREEYSAEQDLLRALEMMQTLPEDSYETDLATAWTNLALFRIKTGRAAEGKTALDKAKALFERHEATADPHYASVLNAMGQLAFQEKDYQKAVAYFSKASDCMEALFGRNREVEMLQQYIRIAQEEAAGIENNRDTEDTH